MVCYLYESLCTVKNQEQGLSYYYELLIWTLLRQVALVQVEELLEKEDTNATFLFLYSPSRLQF